MHFFSSKRRNEKAHEILLILTPVIKTGLPHKLNRIEYESHLALRRVSSEFHSFFCDFHSFFAHPISLKGLVVFDIFKG